MSPAKQSRARVINSPLNLGLYLDRSPLHVPDGGMTDCLNVRVRDGRVQNRLLGWQKMANFNESTSYLWEDHEVLHVSNWTSRSGASTLLICTATDIYEYYQDVNPKWRYLTPWTDGEAAHENTQAEVLITNSQDIYRVDAGSWVGVVKAGDWFYHGASANRYKNTTTDWLRVASVDGSGLFFTIEDATSGMGAGFPEDWTVRQTFTGTTQDGWSSEMFQNEATANDDLWIACNGVGNQIVKWDGAADQVTQIEGAGDLNFTCNEVLYYKNMMLYGGIQSAGDYRSTAVKNSAIGYPENVTTLEASEFEVSQAVRPLMAMRPLGDAVVVYCEDSVNTITFVGLPLQFVIRTISPDVGLIGKNLVANHIAYHEFLSSDRAYRFDGGSLVEIGSHIFREAVRSVDPERLTRAHVAIDEENGEVLWALPLLSDSTVDGGVPQLAYQQHYRENVGNKPVPYTVRQWPAGCSGKHVDNDPFDTFDVLVEAWEEYDFRWSDRFFSAAFPIIAWGDDSGQLWKLGTKSTINDGSGQVDMESFARFARRPTADGNSNGIILRVEPHIETEAAATYTVDVRIKASGDAEGNLTELKTLDYAPDKSGRRHLSPRTLSRFHEIEVGTVGSSELFAISGYSLDITGAGER